MSIRSISLTALYTGVILAASSGALKAQGTLPDPRLTPGAVFPVGAADVCVRGYSAAVRKVPCSVKKEAYARYGIYSHAPREYEVDHLISLELGGSNSILNLWPESYVTTPWNAHVKDRLENRLHKEVCAGRMTLKRAQDLISGDWTVAYVSYYPSPGGN